ncbi:MAG TPA: flagellar basal body rod protein FlgC [Longimicrobiaceae bacterium]|nr:flagellar basal body rod protein FlgC [Longimicrobiaceae bacterium]
MSPVNGFPPAPYTPVTQPMFRTLAISASGLSAQRARLQVIATNIANAETTRTADGGPYQRQVVQLRAGGVPGQPYEIAAPGEPSLARLPSGNPLGTAAGVEVEGVVTDPSLGPLVYDPGHPDADANGYVRYPNVNMTEELVNLMDARRVYEANATVFQSAKAILTKSLEI